MRAWTLIGAGLPFYRFKQEMVRQTANHPYGNQQDIPVDRLWGRGRRALVEVTRREQMMAKWGAENMIDL